MANNNDWDGVSYDEWVRDGQYPDGTPLDPDDKNMEDYYIHYVETVKEANASGDLALKKSVERQHGIIDTGTATETEKEGYVEYVLGNEDLRETAEALGLTRQEMAEFGHTHYETFGVDKYVYDYDFVNPDGSKGKVTDYGKNIENRANYLSTGANAVIRDREAFQRTYDISDTEFENIIRDYGSADNWLYGGGDPSRMWQARGLIGEEFGDPWNLAGFSGTGWNMDPDNPYARGIRAGTIDVVQDVGQLIDTGDPQFLQDRYEDAYRKEDFPENWVDAEGNWQGPQDLGEYWNAISTAVRNEEGDLRSLIPSSQWATGYDFGGPGTGAGPGVSGMLSTVPYTQPAPQDWSNIMPVSTPLASQQALVSGQGKFYQPWATGQGVPPGLLNYQIPGGPAANLTYSGAQPSLFDAVDAGTGTDTVTGNGYTGPLGGQWDTYHDWYMSGTPWDYPAGGHYAALNRLHDASGSDETFGKWFTGQGGEGASAGKIFGQ